MPSVLPGRPATEFMQDTCNTFHTAPLLLLLVAKVCLSVWGGLLPPAPLDALSRLCDAPT